MSKHGAVTVAKIQTPDLHVSVGGASGNNCAILVKRHTRSESGRLWAEVIVLDSESCS